MIAKAAASLACRATRSRRNTVQTAAAATGVAKTAIACVEEVERRELAQS